MKLASINLHLATNKAVYFSQGEANVISTSRTKCSENDVFEPEIINERECSREEVIEMIDAQRKELLSRQNAGEIIQLNDIIRLNKMNLAGINLSELDLSFVEFSRCDLGGANFEGSDLSMSVFNSVDLENANFKYTNLEQTDFAFKTNLKNADFEGANLKYAQFFACNLEGANFKNTKHLGGDRINYCCIKDAKFPFLKGFFVKVFGKSNNRTPENTTLSRYIREN